MDTEKHLTLAEFAAEVGAHPNTVRKLLREGEVPYTVEDLVTGERVSPEALRPTKFRYLVPASAIQHVAATIHAPVRSSGKVAVGGHSEPTTGTLQGPDEATHKLRADVARLEAELDAAREREAWLRQRVEEAEAERRELVARVPLALPAASDTQKRRSWWRRLFGR